MGENKDKNKANSGNDMPEFLKELLGIDRILEPEHEDPVKAATDRLLRRLKEINKEKERE